MKFDSIEEKSKALNHSNKVRLQVHVHIMDVLMTVRVRG